MINKLSDYTEMMNKSIFIKRLQDKNERSDIIQLISDSSNFEIDNIWNDLEMYEN